MRSPLCEAVVRCQARRLGRAAAAAPLPASVLAVALALAPLASVRVGHALAGQLVDAVSTRAVADAIVLGPALAAAVAGAAFAASLPERDALGGQIAAAPFDAAVGVVAVTLAPVLALALVIAPSLAGTALALGGGLPGGLGSGLALATAVLASLPAGACVAEGGIALARHRVSSGLAVGGAILIWLGVGAALGSAPLGPLAGSGSALRGALPASVALAVSCSTGVALALAWLALAASRPPRRAPRAGRARTIVRGRTTAIPAALAAILSRRRDVRLGAGLAVAFGAAGATLAGLAAAPAPAAFLLGTTTALLGSVLCALSAGGAVSGGRWLWASTPRGSGAVARQAVVVSVVGTAAPVVVVGLATGLAAGCSSASVGAVAGVVVSGAALAVVAGALVPWQGGAGDQLTTFAAFAALAVGVSLLVGIAAPRLVAAGAPDPFVLALVCAACLAAAAVVVRDRLERGLS